MVALVAFALCVGVLAGCEKRAGKLKSAATAPVPTPAAAAVTGPTTAPATVVLTLAGKRFVFAAPRIVVDQKAERLLLYSDKENEVGSFYFEMPIETIDPGSEGWDADLSMPQDERQDTLVGITLKRSNQTLQPVALRVQVMPISGNLAKVTLSGEFLVYPDESSVASTRVEAKADFVAARSEK